METKAKEEEEQKENEEYSDNLQCIEEIRIASIGNVDSGKSTLVGVLSHCSLDDGRGSARGSVFNFKHEKENGRTSSIAEEVMCFKDMKQIIPSKEKRNMKYSKMINQCDKVVTLLDLCGHEKYLKTTIYGLTGLKPDYTMIVIGANMGVQRMTKEHLGIALALKIPLFLVLTKIDIAPEEIYKQTLEFIIKILKSTGAQKMPVVIHKGDDLSVYTESIQNDRLCPIFCVSSVSGEGMTELRSFISQLKSIAILNNDEFIRKTLDQGLPMNVNTTIMTNKLKNQTEFLIDTYMMVNNVGLVINGLCTKGTIIPGQVMNIGPDLKGDFNPVTVKSIHFKQTLVEGINEGNIGALCIKGKDKEITIRKGMLLVDKDYNPICVNEFEAEVVILHHSTTIKPGYKSVIHCENIRQTATVVSLNTDLLRSGDRGIVKFKFVNNPEYLHVNSTILFREGRTRGLGKITSIFI